jgi:hypothetical protein
MGGIGSGLLRDIQRLPTTGAGFTSTGILDGGRHSGRTLPLGCGVVVCGGLGDDGALSSCEGVDGDGRPVSMTASLTAATFSFSFTALGNDAALMAGGSLPTGHLGEARVLRLAP